MENKLFESIFKKSLNPQAKNFWRTDSMETFLDDHDHALVDQNGVIMAKWGKHDEYKEYLFVLYRHSLALYKKPNPVNTSTYFLL